MSVFHVSLAAGRSGDNRDMAAGWQKTVDFLSERCFLHLVPKEERNRVAGRQGRDGIAYMIWNGASTNFHRRGE